MNMLTKEAVKKYVKKVEAAAWDDEDDIKKFLEEEAMNIKIIRTIDGKFSGYRVTLSHPGIGIKFDAKRSDSPAFVYSFPTSPEECPCRESYSKCLNMETTRELSECIQEMAK